MNVDKSSEHKGNNINCAAFEDADVISNEKCLKCGFKCIEGSV